MAEQKQETPRPCPTCGCDGTIEGRHNRELVAAAKEALEYFEQMYGANDSLSRKLKSAITTAEQPEGK